ncbi:MAG: hypothetical protein HYV63_20640 [Candidatus Schekmanbacteria bacterium]|nr:hypothetical protein [Candidatus Schekmanbacteria bacterium]
MDDRRVDIEEALASLSREVQSLAERLRRLEQVVLPRSRDFTMASERITGAPDRLVGDEERRGSLDFSAGASLVGRVLLILGGAFFLRALTEGSVLSAGPGVILGFTYAAAWMVMCGRAARRGSSVVASAYGGAVALIAYPLLWESITHSRLPAPLVGAVALLVAFVSLAIAHHYRLAAVAWSSWTGAALLGFALLPETKAFAAITMYHVGLGVAAGLVFTRREWAAFAWVACLTADFAALITAVGLVTHERGFGAAALAAQLALAVAFLGWFGHRVLVRRENPTTLAFAQSVAVLLLGYLPAVLAIKMVSAPAAWGLGALSGVVAAVGYGAMLRLGVGEAATHRMRGYAATVSFALLLGCAQLLLGAEYGGVAVAAAVWTASRWVGAPLRLQACLAVLLAALGSGLVEAAARAFAGSLGASLPVMPMSAFLALGATALAYALTAADGAATRGLRVSRLVCLAVAVFGIGAVAVLFAVSLAAGAVPPGAGAVAAVRSMTIAAAIVALAALSRVRRFADAGMLVYPILAVGALKLLVEDFFAGSAGALFLALSSYGGALIFGSRVRSRPVAAASPVEETPAPVTSSQSA